MGHFDHRANARLKLLLLLLWIDSRPHFAQRFMQMKAGPQRPHTSQVHNING